MTKNNDKLKIALLETGFRPFFLLAAYMSWSYISLWSHSVAMGFKIPGINNPLTWHSHEIIFGFSMAVIAGFLLTAVQNWSGLKTLTGKALIPLMIIWIIARILPFTSVSYKLIALIDLLFIPYLSIAIARPLILSKKYKNLMLVFLLMLLFICNVLFHLEAMGIMKNVQHISMIISTDLIVLIIIIIAGRIIPFFTGRILDKEKSMKYPVIEIISIFSGFLLMYSHLVDTSIINLKWFFLIAFIAHCFRVIGWYQKGILQLPILLYLYVAYLWLIVGFALKAAEGFGFYTGLTSLHAFTAGGIGVMIFAMMVRVSLGHTGREIKAALILNIAFVLLNFGVVLRVLAPLLAPQYYLKFIMYSGVFWTLAFLIFSLYFTKILCYARPDGKEG